MSQFGPPGLGGVHTRMSYSGVPIDAEATVALVRASSGRWAVPSSDVYRTGWGLLLFVPDLVMRYYSA